MKVKDLIKALNNIKDKERDIDILIGNEDEDTLVFTEFEIHHADDCDQSVEIFCNVS